MFLKLALVILSLVFFAPAHAADGSKALKEKELETAMAMNDMYARHVLSSSCMERQKTYFIPYNISEQEKVVRLNSYKSGCDCLTDTILKTYSANDAIDYVTSAYGSTQPEKKSVKNIQSKPQIQKYAKMMYLMNVDKETRKNCGFQK